MKKIDKTWLILGAILLIGLFFRTYKLEIFYIFEHDQDLYSWIVKDILEGHLRLIGQVTSIEGFFIGPAFYYLLVPFYFLFKMNPMAAQVPAVLLGLSTILSIYFVFSKLFNKEAGLIGAFIYSSSLAAAFWDRWIVPTEPSILWSVWLMFATFSIAKGKMKALPILGILLGTWWDIHLALIPLLLLMPLSLGLAHKKIPIKEAAIGVGLFLVLMAPYFLFELKNHFIQTRSFFHSGDQGKILTGELRFMKIIEASSKSFVNTLIYQMEVLPVISYGLLILSSIFLKFKKVLSNKEIILIASWFGIVILAQVISSKGISEYYFVNLVVPTLLLISLVLGYIYHHFNKLVVIGFLGLFLGWNIYAMVTKPEDLHQYFYKKQIVEYIQKDAQSHNYSCISINYIARYGTAVGFRYLFWWKGVNLIQPAKGAPVYNVVIPWDAAKDLLDYHTGYFGVILPKDPKPFDASICNDPNNQLLPLLGFTK